MKREESAVRRHGLLLVAATLAVQANAHTQSFRQRDLRRMIEFSANWAYPHLDEGGIPFDNTQIRRYLEWLVAEGFARKTERGKHPKYRLTRHGMIELAVSVGSKGYNHDKDEFFYMYFILADYRQRIAKAIEREGRRFPYAVKLEFEELLDSRALLANQLYYAKRELKKLEKRVEDAMQAANFVRQSVESGRTQDEIFVEVERRYPFSLNSALSFSQVLPSLTAKQAIWELTIGTERRKIHLWNPAKEALELHIRQLEQLLAAEDLARKASQEI